MWSIAKLHHGQAARRHVPPPRRLPDMREFGRISETPIHHHGPQLGHTCLSEEKARQAFTGGQPHQAAIDQPLCGRWNLRLPGLGAPLYLFACGL